MGVARSENRLFGSESDGWGRIVTRSDLRYIDITLRFHFGGLWCSAPSAASIPSSEQANICCNSNVTSACRTQFILWKGPDVSMQWQSSHSSWMHITQLNRVFYSAARVVLWNPARPWRTATPLLSTCLYPSLHWRRGGWSLVLRAPVVARRRHPSCLFFSYCNLTNSKYKWHHRISLHTCVCVCVYVHTGYAHMAAHSENGLSSRYPWHFSFLSPLVIPLDFQHCMTYLNSRPG